MSRTYVEKRSVAEQIGIDAGMAVLGLALGAGLLSWFEGWTIPPVNDVLTIGVVGILFVFGLRLVWPLAPDRPGRPDARTDSAAEQRCTAEKVTTTHFQH